MAESRSQTLEKLFIDQLPLDGGFVSNGQLLQRVIRAGVEADLAITEGEFVVLREALLAKGLVVKGKGRGGSTARAALAAPGAEGFELGGGPLTAVDEPAVTATKKATKSRSAAPRSAADEPPQVISYRHSDRRKNNPEVGLVSEASDPQQPKRELAYNPHLDPVLNFDSSRAELENQVADALASGDSAVMKAALEEIQRRGAPYLQWAGKAERTSFEVDTVSLHVHERIDSMSILSAVRKDGPSEKNAKPTKDADQAQMRQASLFEAPFEALPLRDAVDFYRHDKGWANRLVSGDSLQVMNSLLVKEGMAGQVQMVYIDPPYGIKYGSNFQPFVGKRNVKDKSDSDLTQEPEMIKAFRDTWELGIHSYLTYLRARLLLTHELLSDRGSVFVQISDENLHHVRELCDEVFGPSNFISVITTKKTGGMGEAFVDNVSDYVVWYAKNAASAKFNRLFLPKAIGVGGGGRYNQVQNSFGQVRPIKKNEREDPSQLESGSRVFLGGPLTSETASDSTTFDFSLQGRIVSLKKGGWKTGALGMQRLIKANRLALTKEFANYKLFVDDFPAFVLSNLWADTMGTAEQDKSYVVQTTTKVIERCLLMTTDPGDLVLDPTCGSGTTAFVAERWGRRWITCDTSRESPRVSRRPVGLSQTVAA